MLKSKLLKKYLLLGFVITLIFFVIAIATNHLIISLEREAFKKQDSLARDAGSKGALHKESFFHDGPPPDMEDGEGPPPQMGKGPSFPPHEDEFGPKYGKPPFKPREGPRHTAHLFAIFTVQMLAILLAVAFTILIIFFHFKGRTKEVENVLVRIKEGDLKARMPEGISDEFGMAMGKFNLMADEIETLVNRLRDTEATRRVLLSELAHDIRTPLASAMNLLEILKGEKREKLDKEQKQELLELSYKEIAYISRLVEDLLFLGKIEEPSYRRQNRLIDVQDVINDVVSQISVRYPDIKFSLNSDKVFPVNMDVILASRLFRNVLENAFSYAQNDVSIYLKDVDGHLCINVIDDGPGLSLEAIESFGKKKFSRQELSDRGRGHRISIGLGAVIMRAIVASYHGDLQVDNHPSKGAIVKIELPVIAF